jgi:fatty-acyl-CoA synthase
MTQALCSDDSGSSLLRLSGWLRERAGHFGDAVALSAALPGGGALSFRQLESSSATLTEGLQRLGLVRGDAIALWMPSRPVWMSLHFAAMRLGLLTIPLNTWYRDTEVAHFLGLARCRAVFVDRSFRGIDFDSILERSLEALSRSGRPALQWIVDCGVGAEEDVPARVGSPTRVPLGVLSISSGIVQEDDPGENLEAIAYSTSGTTSAPKLAVHREGALLAHAGAVATRASMSRADVVLCALPPCGAYGYTLLMSGLSAGAACILLEEFDLDSVVEIIEAQRVTVLALTEPLVRRLLDHPRVSRRSFRSLRLVFSAGGTLRPVVERAESEFGFRVTNVYGSSELLALAAFWDPQRDAVGRSRAGGLLTSPGMQVRAVNALRQSLPIGTEGELQFRGPIVAGGYLGNAEATARAFGSDGWFSSGDLGMVMDGAAGEFLYVSRMNDALRVKGFLVSPGEVEAALQRHPSILAAQVVGVPDGLGEEAIAAFVIAREGESVNLTDVREFCRARIASYKVPAMIRVIDAFPMTRSANGDKVLKTRLRDLASEEISLQ